MQLNVKQDIAGYEAHVTGVHVLEKWM